MDKAFSAFKSINLVTIIAVYLLILVGGVVRNLGAGMGCPDWPKCFGNYIPPSDASELPEDYQKIFVETRVKKNERLASMLSSLGWIQLAEKILNDPKIRQESTFNTTKAWVEYINRLVGVLIGFLIIMNFWFSLKLKNWNKWIPITAFVALLLVVFQGWIGSLVVSTNLLPGFITFHMMLALLLVGILIFQQFMLSKNQIYHGSKWVIYTLLGLSVVQIYLGTGVRESIDIIHSTGISRDQWIMHLGNNFYVHRSFSILIVLLTVYFLYTERITLRTNKLLSGFGIIICIEIILGSMMAYFSVPAFSQPLHLLFGTFMFGVLFYLFLDINFKTKFS